MFVLGLLVLAAAVVFSVELILANRAQITFHMWSGTWHVDMFWVAVAGAVLLFAAVIALGFMRISLARMRRMRMEHRMLLAEREQMMAARGKQPAATQAPGKAYPAAPPAAPAAAYPAGEETRTTRPAYAGAGAPADENDSKQHRFFGRHSHND
jgi:uncharacterized membrane protein YciS (DUF1049 family)